MDFSNNAPHGDAIVCWNRDKRKVYFQGRLWNDRLNGEVRAVVTSYRGIGANPTLVTTNVIAHTPNVLGNGGNTPDKVIDYTASVTTNDLYRLRVSLRGLAYRAGKWTVVSVHNRYWGCEFGSHHRARMGTRGRAPIQADPTARLANREVT